MTLPPWVMVHVPHDSTEVPPAVRDQFLLQESQLAAEIDRMTDHHTHEIFANDLPAAQVFRAPVSRLVVDVERFVNDEDEPMAAKGMGVVYIATCDLQPLRRRLTAAERETQLLAYYVPHHARLEQAVVDSIAIHGRCLVLDCHSFPDRALPYERAVSGALRPDICIGTDDFHTPSVLTRAFVSGFARPGWRVHLNDPFAGALVPASRYRRDLRVAAVMVELNRRLYMCEPGAQRLPEFAIVAQRVRSCCAAAVAQFDSEWKRP